jgi:cytidyltransferase-like protein
MKYDVMILSGGFDPVHVGHLRMIQAAAEMADEVVVGVNSDDWLMRKKGYVFMPHAERVEIIQGFDGCAKAVGFDDGDSTASDLLRAVREMYPDKTIAFGNGGDRTSDNIPETPAAEETCIELVWSVGGGKVQSSSTLVADSRKNNPNESR